MKFATDVLCIAALALAPMLGCGEASLDAEMQEAKGAEQRLSGYVVSQGDTVVDSTRAKQLQVSCPTGTKVLGAGWAALDPTDAFYDGVATYFAPSDDGSSWSVNVKRPNTDALAWKLHLSVLCGTASALSGYQVVTKDTALTRESSLQLATSCPAGTVVLGSGFGVLNRRNTSLDGEATYFSANYDGSGWLTNARYAGTAAWKLRGFLVCVNASSLPGYEVVIRHTEATQNGSKQLMTDCPNGKIVSSAGWGVLDASGAIWTGAATLSLPLYNGSGWITNAIPYEIGSNPWQLELRLVCLN